MTRPTSASAARSQIFVCGDLHNLGDLKLLLQNLALAPQGGGLVRRWAPIPAVVEWQVEAAGGRLMPGKAVFAFGAEIVLGGGQLVRDNVSIAALGGLLLAVMSARLGGGRLVTRGLGISPIRSPLRRLLWRTVLANCARINLRDAASARNLAMLLPRRRPVVTADMVFLPTEGIHAIVPGAARRDRIVIAPCIDGSEGRSLEGTGTDAAVAFALEALPDATIVIACHDPREGMDKAAAQRLATRWADRDVRIADGYELNALTGLYQRAAIVITNRLHSLIFSILTDAPVLAVEDGSAKVRVVTEDFAIPTLPRDDAAGASLQVHRALRFDRAARHGVRQDMAARAAGNLEPGTAD